jgi:phosphopantothenoylcysteine synthetase/decarboxylase
MTSGDRVDVVAMTAAVADYIPQMVYRVVSRNAAPASDSHSGAETWVVEPADGVGGKIKSNYEQIAVLGARTTKLIDMFRRQWAYRGILIKFKLEVGLSDDQLIEVAGNSRLVSDADLMVANTLAMARPAAGEGGAYLIDGTGPTRVSRTELAAKILQWVKTNHRPGSRL